MCYKWGKYHSSWPWMFLRCETIDVLHERDTGSAPNGSRMRRFDGHRSLAVLVKHSIWKYFQLKRFIWWEWVAVLLWHCSEKVGCVPKTKLQMHALFCIRSFFNLLVYCMHSKWTQRWGPRSGRGWSRSSVKYEDRDSITERIFLSLRWWFVFWA